MILAIVGSVKLANCEKAAGVIRRYLVQHQPELVVSGGAEGIDQLAERIAWEEFGIPTCVFVPTIKAFKGVDGYAERNLKIAQTCTHLLRLAASDSTTYGSGWTRDQAVKLKKPTKEILIQRS